jgi:hypothetical protein
MSLSPIQFHARHRATIDDFQDAELPSLCEVLATIPDPRARRGVRYGFVQLLAVVVAAVMSGSATLTMIAECAADAHDRNLLPAWRRAPSVATIHRIMAAVDAEVLDAVVGQWITARQAHQAHPRPG